MNPKDAAHLAARIARAYPTAFYSIQQRDEAVALFAEKLEPWDIGPATRAVEQVIENCRRFPSLMDLREAYAYRGGALPDPGRDMSPAAFDPAEALTAPNPEDTAAIHDMIERWRSEQSDAGWPEMPGRAGG
jgi:hypothetical protein